MKYQLLILWTLTALVSTADTDTTSAFKVVEMPNGIKLSCQDTKFNVSGNEMDASALELDYIDRNSGEYSCGDSKIFVKFRTCDNCVELDWGSIVGMAVGNVVASAVVGYAVYLLASQPRPPQVVPATKIHKPVNPRRTAGSKNNGSEYQELRPVIKSEYDELKR